MKSTKNNETKKKILLLARKKFFADGFLKTSMDELASEFHISKKTIYKHFKSKDDLLFQVVQDFTQTVTDKIFEIMKLEDNPVVKLVNSLFLLQNTLQQMSLKYLNEIQKHKPKLLNYMEKFRRENLEKVIYQTIQEGKKKGIFNSINPELTFQIFYGAIVNVIATDFLIKHPITIDDAIDQTFDILLNGILTSEGRKTYKRLKRGNYER